MWTIIDMKYRISDGIATEVSAQYQLIDGDLVARNIISIDLPEPNDTIIPFAELTEAQVIEWVKLIYPYLDVEAKVLEDLTIQIDRRNSITVTNGLPWV